MKFLLSALLVLCVATTTINAQCNMCESVVGIIESWVEANNTLSAMESKLDMLCTLVPAFESVCYQVIDFDVKGIIGYLERYGDSNSVCKKIGMCAGLKMEKSLVAKRGVQNEAYCNYCEYLFGILESIVASGAGETEVANYLEVICTVFPSEAICQFGLYNVAPVMIEYFTYVADPSTVCFDFGLCDYPDEDWNEHGDSGEDYEDYEPDVDESAGHDEEDGWEEEKRITAVALHPQDTCNYCTMIVGWLEYYVKSDAGVDEMKAVFDSYICQITQNLDSMCSTLFGDMELVFQYLAQHESPQNVCSKLAMCQDSHKLFNYMREQILAN